MRSVALWEVMQDRSILDNTERRIFLFHPQYKYALSVVTIEQYEELTPKEKKESFENFWHEF